MAQSSVKRPLFVAAQRAVAATLRTTLAAGLASAALFAYGAAPARAQVPPLNCAINPLDGSVVDCTGNHSAGIELVNAAGAFRTLNVFALTANIAPAAGDAGIVFTSDDDVTLNVDAAPFGITTTGDEAPGVFASSVNGTVSIRSFADIFTDGNLSHGIAAESEAGNIDIIARGSIQTDAVGSVDGAFGIMATSLSGDIEIISAAEISTTGDQGVGIFAETAGVAIVESSGNILTRGDGAAGIAVAGQTGAGVISTGNIATEGLEAPGITVISDGEVGVLMSGSITTQDDNSRAIWAESFDDGMVAVGAAGTITTSGTDSDGIWATSAGGLVAIISSANITTTGQDSAASAPSAMTALACEMTSWSGIRALFRRRGFSRPEFSPRGKTQT